jgi:Tol biopolymer transport system component
LRTAAVVACLAVLLVAAPSAHAAFPGANGKIAFTNSDHQIATVNPDGTGETSTQQAGTDASWSADGRKIAFSNEAGHISVMNADGSGVTDLNVPGESPSWSPDGARIAFSHYIYVSGNDEYSFLYLMNADGTGVTRLPCDACWDFAPVWSPDGQWLAFWGMGLDAPEYSLFKVRPDGTDLTQLFAGDHHAEAPDWSPDGTKIVFWYEPGVATINADGTGLTIIDTPPGGEIDATPVWSPDQTKIAFWRGIPFSPPYNLYVIGANGTGRTQLVSGAFYGPDWQPVVGPRRDDYPTAPAFCRAERDFLGRPAFRQKYGRLAFPRCVRQKGGRNRPKDRDEDRD